MKKTHISSISTENQFLTIEDMRTALIIDR